MYEELKEKAALSAVKLVKDGQVVGIGTGSTTYYAIKGLAERIKTEGLEITCIPTSLQTEQFAKENGLKLSNLNELNEIDVTIDGADKVDEHLNLIKGGGGAHTREKLVASCSKRVIIIVDESKLAKSLDMSVPVEVLPFSWKVSSEGLKEIGGIPDLRSSGKAEAPFTTDNGNFILDVGFGVIENPPDLERRINSVPGVVENGIFSGIATEVHVGTNEGVDILRMPE